VPAAARAAAVRAAAVCAPAAVHGRLDPVTRRPQATIGLVWRAVLASRLVIVFCGAAGVLQLGLAPGASAAYDPGSLTAPFGYLPNALVAPLARWDSVWYLTIAAHGYAGNARRMAFFPLYPALIRLLGALVGSDLIAGVLISLAAFVAALLVLHRLVCLDHDREVADTTVLLVAFCPVSFYLSAVYTEPLYLALSVGCLYAARRERWALCGVLGFFAALSRNVGAALIVPAAYIYLYGPRASRGPRPAAARGAGDAPSRSGFSRIAPRHRLRPGALWLLLIPAGLGAYLAYLGLRYGNALEPLTAEAAWYRHTTFPLVTIWQAASQAWEGLRQLLQGPLAPARVPPYAQSVISAAFQDVYLFVFLVLGLVALLGVARRLGGAYALYSLVLMVAALADPVSLQPLAALPRYELVIFPLFIWAALVLKRRGMAPWVLPALAVLLGLFTVEFATWRWVA